MDSTRIPSQSSLDSSIDSIAEEKDDFPSPLEFSVDSISERKESIHVPLHVVVELHHRGFKVDDQGVVRWQENSAAHPRRWPLIRKAYDSALICFLEFFMTLVSNTGSSIAMDAAAGLQISRVSAIAAFATVYLLGQALGGLVLPPICESFGGRTIYVSSTFAFALFCLTIGIWPILPVVIVFRFLSGVMAAMPAVVAAGSLENMWNTKARIFTIHLWISSAVMGLALGPPVATYVSLSVYGWRWIFYGPSIIGFFAAFLCLFMQESRPSQVLRQQVRSVVRRTSFDRLSTDGTDHVPDITTFLRKTLLFPTKLFFREPIVLLTSIMAATVYGVTYLFSEAFTVVYTDGFGLTTRETSLVFFAIAAGVPLTFLPRLRDIYVAGKLEKQGRQQEPEHKLFGFYLAAPILAIGLWWFAFTVPPLTTISPWASIFSLLLFGFAVVEFDTVLSGYLTDTYTSYAASANAPMAFLRAILSGVFPLCGEQLFRNLGANNALFLLAGLASAFCGVAVCFWMYGKRIREVSPFAVKTWAESQESVFHGGSGEDIRAPEECYVRG